LDEVLDHQEAGGPRVSLRGSQFAPHAPLAYDPRDQPVGSTVTRPFGAGSLPLDKALARGWTYPCRRPAGGEVYGSMTAAGVSSLAIALEGIRATGEEASLSPKRATKALEALRDGLGWLCRYYDPARNRFKGHWYYYYLYSVEKAMDTAGIERLGPHEWWRDLAAELLVRQKDDGSWGSIEHTSFALLVLNRATLPVQLELGEIERVATGGHRDPSTWDKVAIEGPDGKKFQVGARQVLLALADAPDQASERLGLAREAVAALDERHRPRLVPELRRLLTHPHRATRRWARESCVQLAGTDHPESLELFSERWEILLRAGENQDTERIPEVRLILASPEATLPLKRQAILTLIRLRAVEALGDLIAQLRSREPDYRQLVWSSLISLAGGAHRPFSPRGTDSQRRTEIHGWEEWLSEEGPHLVEAEEVRRAVRDLAVPERAHDARERLVMIGRPAVRPLIDALRADLTHEQAHNLLVLITGQDLPPRPEPWLEWLEAKEEREDD
jgi:hypothetical protein